MIELTIVIPVYNIEPYLEACFLSLAEHKGDSAEFILVDDGSTDGSGGVCDRWAARDPRFRVVHTVNGGVSSARNTGLKLSRGRWIGFVDGDDWLESGAIDKLLEQTALHPEADMMCFGFFDHCTGGKALPEAHIKTGIADSRQAIENVLLEGGYFTSVWNKLFRRELVLTEDKELYFDTTLSVGEDEKYLIEAMLRCEKCLCIPDPVYHYRYRESSALNASLISEARLESLNLKKTLAEMLKNDRGLYAAAKSRMYNRAIPLLVSAYCNDRHDAIVRIRRSLKGTWRCWLQAGDISAARKVKVLAVCTMIRLHAPKSIVSRLMNINKTHGSFRNSAD